MEIRKSYAPKKWLWAILMVSVCVGIAFAAEKIVYCKYCGCKAKSVQSSTANKCQRHPNGAFKVMHVSALK